jgi:hypothetical protein
MADDASVRVLLKPIEQHYGNRLTLADTSVIHVFASNVTNVEARGVVSCNAIRYG